MRCLCIALVCLTVLPALAADNGTLKLGDFECVVGNNAAWGDTHKQKYNGVFQITMPGLSDTPFVPFYAGLNLEHYFDTKPRSEKSEVFFEPRHAPMSFEQLSDTKAVLHQPETPHYGVESWTTFSLTAPGVIDMEYRCTPHKADAFEGDALCVFWASYMNAPINKSIYFLKAGSTLDTPQWYQYGTQTHGSNSSVFSENDVLELDFYPGQGNLYASPAEVRYAAPFYYGRFRDHVVIFIFKTDHVLRMTQSPSGGGRTPNEQDTNPAWDFQLLVPDYKVGEEYALDVRMVIQPWTGRDDVIKAYREFVAAER